MKPTFPALCADSNCGTIFDVDDKLAYRRISCPDCGAAGPAIPARIRQQLLAKNEQARVPDLPHDAFVAIVEDLRSINNVGSIFRTCDAMAVDLIVLCGITATPLQPKLARTALGAERSVPWVWRRDAATAIGELRRFGLTAVALEHSPSAVSPATSAINLPLMLIVGNEVAGVSSPALDLSDHHLEIPMRGVKSSLNAAVAFGMVAWEVVRES